MRFLICPGWGPYGHWFLGRRAVQWVWLAACDLRLDVAVSESGGISVCLAIPIAVPRTCTACPRSARTVASGLWFSKLLVEQELRHGDPAIHRCWAVFAEPCDRLCWFPSLWMASQSAGAYGA